MKQNLNLTQLWAVLVSRGQVRSRRNAANGQTTPSVIYFRTQKPTLFHLQVCQSSWSNIGCFTSASSALIQQISAHHIPVFQPPMQTLYFCSSCHKIVFSFPNISVLYFSSLGPLFRLHEPFISSLSASFSAPSALYFCSLSSIFLLPQLYISASPAPILVFLPRPRPNIIIESKYLNLTQVVNPVTLVLTTINLNYFNLMQIYAL